MPTTEIFHVDFKNKKLKRRQVIQDGKAKTEPFKATKDPFVKDFTKLICEVAQDAHEEGIDFTKMAVVLYDSEKNSRWVAWDRGMASPKEMIEALDKCRERLIELSEVTNDGNGCA